MVQSLHHFFLFLFFSFFFHMGSFRRLSSTMVATFLILATTCMPLSQSAYDVNFTTCNASFHCGNIPQELKYPFWGDGRPDYCGDLAFKIDCPRDNYPEIRILDTEFQVRDVNGSDQRMRISGMNLSDDCPAKFVNPELDDAHFQIAPGLSRILSIYYGCRPEFMRDLPNYVVCGDGYGTFYLDKAESSTYSADLLRNLTNSCSGIADIPINNQNFAKLSRKEIRLFEAINEGFDVKYDTHVAAKCSACESSKGLCGTSLTSDDRFVCFCPDEPHRDHCIVHDGLLLQQKIATAVAAALFVGIVMSIGVCVCHRRKEKKYSNSAVFWMKKEHNPRSIEAFIRDYQSLAPKRYSHVDIKKMTHSFKDKLGQGGYGGVYKGKLLDGRLVAVKVLNSAKGSGEDFINEVASISRTSHVNIVGLMGFCFEGSSRALIYEFMPNGSLEKFIRNDNSSISDDKQLGVELLYKIAIGVAQGLGYLHRGCSTRILHFDIKPHNILLDEDFIPKISDFGLAKLCPSKESIISMMEARGTIGYVAPEVFSRHFGGVSHKSDVYSYGMMILEMVGGKNDINAAALSNSSVTYFPHWIYKRLELQEDLAFHNSMTVAEKDKARRMIIVGLWCIQTDPSHRPSMSKVIEMLTGSSEALQIPPKPFLCSPPRLSPTNSFTASDLEIEL